MGKDVSAFGRPEASPPHSIAAPEKNTSGSGIYEYSSLGRLKQTLFERVIGVCIQG